MGGTKNLRSDNLREGDSFHTPISSRNRIIRNILVVLTFWIQVMAFKGCCVSWVKIFENSH